MASVQNGVTKPKLNRNFGADFSRPIRVSARMDGKSVYADFVQSVGGVVDYVLDKLTPVQLELTITRVAVKQQTYK